MCSAPGNPAICNAVVQNIARRRECQKNESRPGCSIYELGPALYMSSVSMSIFGIAITRDPPEQLKTFIEYELKNLHPAVVTYSEHPPFDTLLYQLSAFS